jgi:hypothetical protein
MVIRFCNQFDFDFVEPRFVTVLHLPLTRQLAGVKKINCSLSGMQQKT